MNDEHVVPIKAIIPISQAAGTAGLKARGAAAAVAAINEAVVEVCVGLYLG